jgi:glucokinase
MPPDGAVRIEGGIVGRSVEQDGVILAADVGGTKTLVGLFHTHDGGLLPGSLRRLPSRDYPSLEALLVDAAPRNAGVRAASLGVAGPVTEEAGEITNLGWTVTGDSLRSALGVDHVLLLNDLEAMAHGIPLLGPEQVLTLSPGGGLRRGHAALIAAGTGLGECFLCWNGREHVPAPGEAGHTDFAPRTPLEIELLERLLARERGPVSWERVLSGSGLVALYEFLRDRGSFEELPSVAAEMHTADPASVIYRAGSDGRCSLSAAALDFFVELYGAEAGNLALRTLPMGGLYVGGGIAARMAPRFAEGAFMRAFLAKDRMSSLLAEVPVRLILEETTALLGAARWAQRRLAGASA